MKGKDLNQILLISLLILATVPCYCGIITFEEGLGKNREVINDQYAGVTFQSASSGEPWLYCDITTYDYNASSWPSGENWDSDGSGEYWTNDYVCAWTQVSGEDGLILFNAQDATYVQINYSSASKFYLEAYNAVGALIDVDSGPANLRYADNNSNGPGVLRVNAPHGQKIAGVIVHDSGNHWIIDNLQTDASFVREYVELELFYEDHDTSDCFQPDEFMEARYRLLNKTHYDLNIDLYIALYSAGQCFFWPSWSDNLDSNSVNLDGNQELSDIFLQMEWPAGMGEISDLTFFSVPLESQSGMIVGNWDSLPLCAN